MVYLTSASGKKSIGDRGRAGLLSAGHHTSEEACRWRDQFPSQHLQEGIISLENVP